MDKKEIKVFNNKRYENFSYIGVITAIVLGLYLSSFYNYLLFHGLIEMTTIAIAFTIFILTWNTRRFLANNYLSILGIGYAFIALIDVLHTLAYKGMNIFPGSGANLPTQLWIAARCLQAVTLLIAPFFVERKTHHRVIFGIYAVATSLLVALIYSGAFPACYIEGKGLTTFKIGSEYLMVTILLIAIYFFYRIRKHFDNTVYLLILSSTACTAFSGIMFTSYINVYDVANMAGHFAKLAAFYLLYRAILVTGFQKPFAVIFRDLARSEKELRQAYDTLEEKVRERTAELETANRMLQEEISERKVAEQRISLLSHALDQVREAAFIMDYSGLFRYVNDAACRSLGYSRDELLSMTPLDIDPDITPEVLRQLQDTLLTVGPTMDYIESRHRARDGRIFPVELSGSVFEYDGVKLALTMARDITARKQMEITLRESEERFRLLVELSPDLIFIRHQEEILYANPAAARMTGAKSAGELIGRSILDFALPERRESLKMLIAANNAKQAGEVMPSYEGTLMRLDGSLVPIELTAIRFQYRGMPCSQLVMHDITERKLAKRKLHESEQRLRLALEAAQIGIWDWDVANDNWYASPTYYTMLGYEPRTDPADRNEWLERVHPDDRTCVMTKIQDVLSRDFTEYRYEARMLHADGTYRWQQVIGFGIERDRDGKVTRMLGVRADITERKLAEEALATREQQFRTLAENSPDSILRYDTACRCIYANPRIEKTLGIPIGGMPDKTPMELFPQGEYREYQARIEEVLRTGTDTEIEVVLPDTGEGIRHHHVRFTAERNQNNVISGVLVIGHDITERKQAEQERLAHVKFLENMDRVNRAIQGANDLEKMMSDVLDVVLSIFDCDRAYLLYPCDPEAATWSVPMEQTKPEYPGVLGRVMPMTPQVAEWFRILLASDGPVQFGPEGHSLDVAEQFGFKSFMSMALHPKTGMPWQFAIHHCSCPRIWGADEEKLLLEVGRRLADALTGMLTYRNLQESERRLALIKFALDNTQEGAYLCDTLGHFIYVNDEAYRPLGYRQDELYGMAVDDIICEDWALHVCGLMARGTLTFEAGHKSKDGRIIPVELNVKHFNHNDTDYILALARDITERKQAEQNLRQLNEELEERVRDRTADLERANARLQQLDLMKSMFIASMSHELRTPLNSVIGFSRILLNEWAGPLNDGQKDNLATILRSGNHLLSLVNDVIDVSKIESGIIDVMPEEFDAHDVVSDAVAAFENDIRDKGIDLKVEAIHYTMRTDRTRLLQCLLNLVSNAIKYTEQGTITICEKLADNGGMLELSVADTGIGIPDHDIVKLFSPFVRLDSPLTTTVPGTGLGLYLTRKLVKEVLQGDLTVASAAGVGSVFVLTVPVNL